MKAYVVLEGGFFGGSYYVILSCSIAMPMASNFNPGCCLRVRVRVRPTLAVVCVLNLDGFLQPFSRAFREVVVQTYIQGHPPISSSRAKLQVIWPGMAGKLFSEF